MASSSSSPAPKYLGFCKTVTKLAVKGAMGVYGWVKNKAGPLKAPIEVAEGIAASVSPIYKVVQQASNKALTFADNLMDRGITFVETKLPDVLKPVLKLTKRVPGVLNDVLELGPAATFKKLSSEFVKAFPGLAKNFLKWIVKQPNGEKILVMLLRGLLQLAKLYNSTLPTIKRLPLPYVKALLPVPVETLELMIKVMQQFSGLGEILVQALIYVIDGDIVGLTTLAAKAGLDIAGKLTGKLTNVVDNAAGLAGKIGGDVLKAGADTAGLASKIGGDILKAGADTAKLAGNVAGDVASRNVGDAAEKLVDGAASNVKDIASGVGKAAEGFLGAGASLIGDLGGNGKLKNKIGGIF